MDIYTRESLRQLDIKGKIHFLLQQQAEKKGLTAKQVLYPKKDQKKVANEVLKEVSRICLFTSVSFLKYYYKVDDSRFFD